MDPITLGLMGGLQAIPDIYNLVTGIRQQRAGKKTLAGLQRPEYNIPGEINSALTLTKSNYADPRFAGQGALENRIGANQANAIQMAYDSGNPMDAISTIQGNSNNAAMQVGAEQARQQRADMGELVNMMDVLAKYKDQQWQLNKFAPYAQKYNEGREQVGAGQTNIANGLSGLASIGSNILGGTIGGMGNVAGGGIVGANAINNAGYGAYKGAGLSQAGINAGNLAGAAASKALQSQYYQMLTNMYNAYGPGNVNQYFNRPQ